MVQDTHRHKGLRKRMLQDLRDKGIEEEKVLEAMGKVPRHAFLDDAFLEYSYQDRAFPIDEGQTISRPYTVASQTSLLKVRKGHRILEVGTGSGYQAAVLAEMRTRVVSVERQRSLYDKSSKLLKKMGYRVRTYFGDGYEGAPAFAPFDRILVTCGAPSLPEQLLEQLAPGGLMLIPVGDDEEQRMKSFEKDEEDKVFERDHGSYRFVPMMERKKKGSDTL